MSVREGGAPVPVVIVDVGSGNLANLARVVALAGGAPRVSTDAREIARARTLLLPGVGAFGPARERLRGALEEAIRAAVESGAWLGGVCLGFQLLFESSEESGGADGLRLLRGHVRRLPERAPGGERLQVPHMGWNLVRRRAPHPVLDALGDEAAVYYVHSFAPVEVPADEVVGTTLHGVEFTAAAARDRVLGVQFHPEKSGDVGVGLLRRFVAVAGAAAERSRNEVKGAPTRTAPERPTNQVTAAPPVIARSAATKQSRLPAKEAGELATASTSASPSAPPFELLPAIDLRHGQVVRLLHGDDAARTTYGDDPAAVLRAYAAAGARWVHVVDLDAAFGEPPQLDTLARLLATPGRPRVELGGGMRDAAAIERALAAGADRVVVGSLVAREPQRFRALAAAHPGRLVPALDIAAGRVRVSGWREEGPPWQEVAAALRGLPCPAVLVTAVERDGALRGADRDLAAAVARASGVPALLSGGVHDLDELAAAARTPGLAGAVVGRALYEGAFTVEQALAAIAAAPPGAASGAHHPSPVATHLAARVIPCLDVQNGRVVKGVRFRDLVDQGVPAEAARRYQAQGADELVFLDIGAAPDARDTATDWVEAVARELTIPLTVGGGVRALDDALRLLGSGADKVGVNTAAVTRPALLSEIAERCGQQCVVLAVDAKRVAVAPGEPARWQVVTHGGRRETGIDALEWLREGVARGAGEVLLTSVDADGTRGGYDLELLRAASAAVGVPVIASGGAGHLGDLARALLAGASAVLAASLFHQGDVTVREAKRYLRARGLAVRLDPARTPAPASSPEEVHA